VDGVASTVDNVLINPGAQLEVIAGETIILTPGFTVLPANDPSICPPGFSLPTYSFGAYTVEWARGTHTMFRQSSETTATPPAKLEQKVTVYPNPTAGDFSISTGGYAGLEGKVELLNLFGESLETLTDNGKILSSYTVNADQLAAGTYLIKVASNKQNSLQRVLIVK
jgi:hypothetical protein